MVRMSETAKTLPYPAKGREERAGGNVETAKDRAAAALLDAVSTYADLQGGGEGVFQTPMNGVCVIRTFRHVEANHALYRPSLCVVVQGGKEIHFGGEQLDYATMQCLIINLEIPACGRIVAASPDKPFIGLNIDLDAAMMREVLEQMDSRPATTGHEGPSLFVADIDEPLADCLVRLMRMSATPKAVPILHPSVMREIYYWLLTGPYAGEICKQVMPDTHMERIAKAIRVLRERFTQTLRVEQLAEAARMSPSSFHQHFREMTSMTPLQFQKQLRLLEARRLMTADAVNVTEAAYQVGYESPSQFSREYSRAFGVTPKRDAITLRALVG